MPDLLYRVELTHPAGWTHTLRLRAGCARDAREAALRSVPRGPCFPRREEVRARVFVEASDA